MSIKREIIQPKNDMLNVSRNFKLPHSPGIKAGDFIFLSGMVSVDDKTGERNLGTVAQETHQILSNMKHMLESAGSSMERVVKINVLLYDMLEFENMNAVYRKFFPKDPPARVWRSIELRDESRNRVYRPRRLNSFGARHETRHGD
jgi:2-iminobutanoate/2-iminopropanoate deaminase